MFAAPDVYADENKPQLQRGSRKISTTPAAAAAKKLAPESSTKKSELEKDNNNTSDNQANLVAEVRKFEHDRVIDILGDLKVKPEVANKILNEFNDAEKSSVAKARIVVILNAAADMDSVGVDQKVRDAVVDAVSRSNDPEGTADKKVGEAATEEFFGKDVLKLVPAEKMGRNVFTALIGISVSLNLLGANPDDPEVINAINEGAKLGVSNEQEARVVMEKAALKVLDRQGFTAAKPGESLNDRLARMVEEQKKLQAELNEKKAAEAARVKAEKAALAAKAAAKARIATTQKLGKGNVGTAALAQGAAGSTTAGRSVSAKVNVAIGGGEGNTSGAGTAKQGTGLVASQASGVGGQTRQDLASSRLAAGSGGQSLADKPSSGKQADTSPGASVPTNSPPAASQTAEVRSDFATGVSQSPQTNSATTTANPTEANSSANEGGSTPSTGKATVTGGDFLLNTPNNNSGSTPVHYDTDNPNVGVDMTYNSDNTYTGVVTVVTRDVAGSIVSVSETPVTGTWGYDSNGQPKPATQTVGETTSTSSNTNNQTSNSSSSSNSEQENTSDEDDDDNDDDDDDKESEDPPPAEEVSTEETETETTTEENKAASTTPNPMDIGGGDPGQLSINTGGRLGGQEARRQQRSLDLARFGGAAGPNPNGKGGVPTLLTPEEMSNAEKALNMRRGAGVTNPNPLNKGSVVATDRDLKEMHLRGNGGAKGPTDNATPTKPQDPNSPVGGAAPGPVPSGGTRINVVKNNKVSVKKNLSIDRRIAEDALKATFDK